MDKGLIITEQFFPDFGILVKHVNYEGTFVDLQGSHRLGKYLNLQDCLEKTLKIKLALKST